jgi:DNA-binding transcriptional LysR family regulator
MELTQVRYFLALCRTLNFSRAAEQCNVTQPAFSRAIQRLEEEFGGALIYRERNLTQLTALGREMQPHLQVMQDAAESAQAVAAASRPSGPGSLRIGLGPGVGAGAIAGVVAEVLRVFPTAELHFTEAAPGSLTETMLADGLDCALLPEDAPLPDRLNRWPLYTEVAVLVCPAGHNLARLNSCTAKDLAGEVLLVGDACGGFGQMLLAASNVPVQLRQCRGAAAQILELVGAGLGVALLSNRLSVGAHLATRKFAEPELSRRIQLAAVAGRPLSPAASSFLKLCRAQAFS